MEFCQSQLPIRDHKVMHVSFDDVTKVRAKGKYDFEDGLTNALEQLTEM